MPSAGIHGEDAQQRADFGVDQGQIARRALLRDFVEHVRTRTVEARKIALDGIRDDLTHNAIVVQAFRPAG